MRAVERAIDILQSFSAEQHSMTVPDLQRKTGLSRPTLYRLLATLAGKGMVRADGDPQRFSLDHGAARFAQIWMARFDLTIPARPIVERLRDAMNETAALFVLRDGRQFCVLEAPSRQVLAMSRGLGEMEQIGRGASGKAILAFLDPDRVRPLLDDSDDRLDDRLADLAAIRRRGYAVSQGEVFVGAVAIAAPVFDRNGIAGSIGLFGPKARMPARALPGAAQKVMEAARLLSAELGHVASTPPGDRRA